LLLNAAENGGIVMMARIAVAQALTGRKVTPELRFVDGAVFLGAPERSRKRHRCSDPV
jgi:hypothetical protein